MKALVAQPLPEKVETVCGHITVIPKIDLQYRSS